jgi:T5SS/PEP-CTERM-associated repeat protein
VDGIGSKWTVETLVLPNGGAVISTNGAELSCGELLFQDVDGFAEVFASGTNSRITVRDPLRLTPGTMTAQDGGIINASELELGVGGRVKIQQGSNLSDGAQFNCAGDVRIGTSGAAGAGTMTVGSGGRASAQTISVGRSSTQSILTVDALEGPARFVVAERVLVGEKGQGLLRVANGGWLEFTRPDGLLVITPEAGGDGELTVEGANSFLDLKSGSMQVGKAGVGKLTVASGAKLFAGSLTVGDISGPPNRTVQITGANSSVQLNGGSVHVASGVLRVVNGGLLRIPSISGEGSLSIVFPAVVDFVGGRIEIGPADAPSPGTLSLNRGLLRGSGTIRGSAVEVTADGRLQPGIITGNRTLRIQDGRYLQDASGTLEIFVATSNQVTTLNVDKSVVLNGKLIINFPNGFTPQPGDQIGFLRFGEGLSGAFSSVTLNGLAPTVSYEQRILSPNLYGLAFLSNTGPCTDPRPTITKIVRSPLGEVNLTVLAGVCGTHRLEYSEELAVWTWVRDFAGNAFGEVQVSHQPQALLSNLFYRVVRDR